MPLATQARINNWFKTAVGKRMNPDKAFGYQCKDVIDNYAQAIFGVAWPKSVTPTNARGLFKNAPSAYWTRIKNDRKNPNQLPKKGDVLVWTYLPYGHTAVVESADKKGVVVIQQDGVLQTAAHRKYYPWGWRLAFLAGWLRPKLQPTKKKAPVKTVKVKAGWGLSRVAQAAGFKDWHKEARWAAIAKLNGSNNWRTYNRNLRPNQTVRVRR